MTQTFATSASDNDLYIGADGNLAIATGQLAVEDACKTISQMRLGEAVLQTSLGMPMFQAIFTGVPMPAVYENALRTTLAGVEGVDKVTVVNPTLANNTFSYTVEIESVYGQTFLLNG